MSEIFELQKLLSSNATLSGNEYAPGKIADIIRPLAEPWVDEIYTDAMGNLICHKKGEGKKLLFTAHMDAIGFYVRSIDEEGFLWVDGPAQKGRLINTPMRMSDGRRGVLRFDPDGKAYIDVGTQKGFKLGDWAVFDTPTRLIAGGKRISTPYADDLALCVAMLLAMRDLGECPWDIYFVFSVQEEVGCRGAKVIGQAIRADMAIALDTNGTKDSPEGEKGIDVLALGAGPAVRYRDGKFIANLETNVLIEGICDELGMKHQLCIHVGGGTDATTLQEAGGKVNSIGLATRYTHSPAEMYEISDLEDIIRLVKEICRRKADV